MMKSVDLAGQYTKIGWPIFPIKKSGTHKAPHTANGVKDASTDADQIKEWWQTWPDANIGIATGPAGLVVIDVDPRHGGTVKSLPLETPDLETVTVRTGGGGWHIYYRAPRGFEISCSSTHLPPGVDVRAQGGYVVAPPSMHESGNYYRWEPGKAPEKISLLPLPSALLPILKTKEPPPKVTQSAPKVATAPDAIQNTLDRLAEWRADDYDLWTRVGMALHDHMADAGLPIWEQWSTQSAKYEPGACERKWKSFKTGGGITWGTIVHWANEDTPPLAARMPRADHNGAYQAQAAADHPAPDLYLLTQGADDEGNAQCVNRLYAGQLLFCAALGWLFYNGRFWETENAETFLDRAIVDTLITRRVKAVKAEREKIVKATRPTATNTRNCKYLFKSLVAESISVFDANPDLLNCRNGVVNLRTGELTPHISNQRFTYAVNADYDPAADDRAWVDWLYSTIRPEDDTGDGREYIVFLTWLQMAVGYSLTGRTIEQCLFYLFGPTRAGKGIFQQVLNALIGRPLSASVDFDTFTGSRKDSQNFDLAPLRPTRFVTASESERANMLNSKVIKGMTGNDPIYCAFKHRDHFQYTPQFKIWLASNFMVNTGAAGAADDALWGRMRVIHFPNSHLGKEDFQLLDKLTRNLAGVLKWAVDGAIAWYAKVDQGQGLGRPRLVEAQTHAHRGENDTVQQFIDDKCETGPDKKELVRNVSRQYTDWCDAENTKPLWRSNFNQSMRSKKFEQKVRRVGKTTAKYWIGLTIRG